MDLRDRIDASLKTKELDDRDFERCAYHFLKRVYPQLTLITGGTDLGRDADIGALEDSPRLLVTTGPLLTNLKRGIKRMKEKGISISKGVVMATSRVVHGTEKKRLAASSKSLGAKLIQVHDRSWLADELMGDGYWRRRLLEVTSELAVLVPKPFELGQYGENLNLVGRGTLLNAVNQTADDLIVIGPPGMGKTRLLADAERVVFLEHNPDSARLAEDLDEMKPALVVVEDAARRADDLRILQRMRIEERHRFRIAATVWRDEAELVQDHLEKARPIELELLERPDMDRILAQLGVTGYWHRSAILDQASGRPGWAVILAKTAVAGQSRSVFDGQALAREVERYLAIAGDSAPKQRVLAHVALYDGIAEEDLGILAGRLNMALPDVTSTLHATTHNGILERIEGLWRVRPQALRVALIERWFLAPDALEPLAVLLRQYPDEEATLVRAALESALQGSRRGAEIGRKLAPDLTAQLIEGDTGRFRVLELYADLDENTASWAIRERVLPAIANPNAAESIKSLLRGLARSTAERFQVPEAIHMLLDDAVHTGLRTNDPGHPLRILGDAARRIVPELRPDPSRRIRIFNAALQWLDRDPTEPRWIVFTSLMESVLSPDATGTWGDPGQPLSLVLSDGVDHPDTLELVASELWPELDRRLGQAPDQAVIPMLNLLSDWVHVAQGGQVFQQPTTEAQQRAAKLAVSVMTATLEARARSAPGLAVRMRRVMSDRLKLHLKVDRDFDAITTDSVEALQGKDPMLLSLAKRWTQQGPKTVLARIRAWEPQLQFVGPGMTHERQVLAMISRAVPDPQKWAEETVSQSVEAGAVVFYDALTQRKDGKVPRWFSRALNEPTLRSSALSAALRPGVPQAIAGKALLSLDKSNALAIRYGLLEREAPDGVLSAILRHRVPEIRAVAALELGPPPQRRIALSQGDERAWDAAVVGYNPEDFNSQFEYELGQALEYLARTKPNVATKWFRRRLKLVGKLRYAEVWPRLCRPALQLLPMSSKMKLLAEMPKHWRTLLFDEGLAGDNPDWVIEAVDRAAITVEDASQALQELDFDMFKRLAKELVKRGLDPLAAVVHLDSNLRIGNASEFFAQLVKQSEAMAQSKDPDLASIGRAGIERYTRLRDAELRREHLERVFGI
jgi:hypothetical protein